MKKCLVIFLFFVSSPTIVLAQDFKTVFKEAKQQYDYELYREAIPLLEQAMQLKPGDALVEYMLGKSYLQRYMNAQGLIHVRTAYELNPNVDPEVLYWLGYAYHVNYDFDKGIECYNAFLKTLKPTDSRIAAVQKCIEECNHGNGFVKEPGKYEIRNIGKSVNSPYAEYGPVTTMDAQVLYFTSQKGMEGQDEKDAFGEYKEAIFVSYRDSLGYWSTPVPFDADFTGHNSAVQLASADSLIFFYSETNSGDIYQSTIGKGEHSNPFAVMELNSVYSETDLFVSKDGKVAIVSSDRNTKNKDLDLFISNRLPNGKWSTPVNMGNIVNSDHDETAPCLSDDGLTLYFSSRGHNSMGGYDIFKSELDLATGQWKTPHNFGYPLNTPADDLHFYFNNGENWGGFFSSDRNGGYGEKDIYEVTFVPNVFVKGEVAENTMKDTLEIQFWATKRNGKDKLVAKDFIEPGSYEYCVNVVSSSYYKVYVLNGADTIISDLIYVPEYKAGDRLLYTFNIGAQEKSPLDPPPTARDSIAIQQTEKSNVVAVQSNPNSMELVDTHGKNVINVPLVDENNQIANNTGNTSGNNSGSNSRSNNNSSNSNSGSNNSANAGSGSNANNSGSDSNYNSGSDSGSDYASGNNANAGSNTIASGSNSTNTGSSAGSNQSSTTGGRTFTPVGSINLRRDHGVTTFEKNEIKPGCRKVLQNIYFDFNAYTINMEASMAELNNIVCMMSDHPNIKVQISGHTDYIGGAQSNKILSQKRAEAVVNYLVKKGIAKNRLVAVGYGEEKPIASNDDEEEGRELNRRTEFLILESGEISME